MIVLMFIMKLSSCMSSSCAPPPPYVMCCCVMLRASTHLKHGTPIMLLLLSSVCVRKFQLFWGSSFDSFIFCEVFNFIFLLSFHPALLWKLCLGECCPPSSNFSQKPHALYPHHAHTHTHAPQRSVGPPASYPPSAIHTVHIQKPSRSLIQTPHIH